MAGERHYILTPAVEVEEDDGVLSLGAPAEADGFLDFRGGDLREGLILVVSRAPVALPDGVEFGDGTNRIEDVSLTPTQRTRWASMLGLPDVPSGPRLLDVLWETATLLGGPERFAGILPRVDGSLNLHIAGHSLVRTERMPRNPTRSPYWARLQAVYLEAYRQIRRVDPRLARKWAGHRARALRIDLDRAAELLVPGEFRGERPLPPKTTYTDNFNDGDLTGWGDPNSDAGWGNPGTLARNDGSGVTGADKFLVFESDLSGDDHRAQAAIDWNGSAYAGVMVRFATVQATAYRCAGLPTGNKRIHRFDNGTRSSILATGDDTVGSEPLTIHGRVDGSDVEVQFEGGSWTTYTDLSPLIGQTRCGIGGNVGSSVNTDWDDFETADLGGGGPAPPPWWEGTRIGNGIELWQDFEEPDGTSPAALGWTVESGSVEVEGTNGILATTTTGAGRVHREFTARPTQIMVTIDPLDGQHAVNVRYTDANNFIRVRWDRVADFFRLEKYIDGTLTTLDQQAMPSAHGGGAYDLLIEDDGTDITVELLGYGHVLSASNGTWSNELSASKGLALFFNGAVGTGFRNIRVWTSGPTYNGTTSVEPMWGTYEKSRHSSIRHVGTFDRTYTAWVTPWGALQIRYYSHDDDEWSSIVTIDDLAPDFDDDARDDHNYPTVVVNSSGKLVVAAAIHLGGESLWWVSASAEDISSWSSRSAFGAGGNYPTTWVASNGDVYMLYRSSGGSTDGAWSTRKSTDGGATWGTPVSFADDPSDGFYCFAHQDPDDADHIMVFSYLSSASSPTRFDVYYIESDDGGATWQTVDGAGASLPLAASDMDLVFDTGSDQCRVSGVGKRGANPAAVIAYKSDPDTEYRYVWWNGSSWSSAQITTTETWWNENGSSELPGGADIDPNADDDILISTPVNGVWELQRWRTADGGSTWAKVADVSTGSERDNSRPTFVRGYHADFPFTWVSGDYHGNSGENADWDGYSDSIIMTSLLEAPPQGDRRHMSVASI